MASLISAKSPSALALIAANLVPLVGVLFFGWDAAYILHLYWAENVLYGLLNLLRLLTNRHPSANLGGKLFVSFFFAVHYGFFCFAHAMFVFRGSAMPLVSSGDPGSQALRFLGEHWLVLVGFFASHLISFFLNYHGKDESRRMTPNQVMGLPYRRVMILHVTIIFGGMAVMALGHSASLVAALVLAKTVGDLVLHLREHRGPTQP